MSNRGTSPVLTGRTAEAATLADVLRTVRHGGPATLLVGGEAGVGKTRLLRDSLCRALPGPYRNLSRTGGGRPAIRTVHCDAA